MFSFNNRTIKWRRTADGALSGAGLYPRFLTLSALLLCTENLPVQLLLLPALLVQLQQLWPCVQPIADSVDDAVEAGKFLRRKHSK